MSMSAILFFSKEPQRSDRPRAAAALMVAAARASSMDILRVTQARCITRGCMDVKLIMKDVYQSHMLASYTLHILTTEIMQRFEDKHNIVFE